MGGRGRRPTTTLRETHTPCFVNFFVCFFLVFLAFLKIFMLAFKYYYLLQLNFFLTHMNASITAITLCNFYFLFLQWKEVAILGSFFCLFV